ncbi:hypothetical protein HDV00_006509 [Rhizophlyctis rosea]|nr:hypothetical protein HDV00_006509 [Rhizophlyctis rosea]
MTDILTLPDFLILFFSHPDVTVPALLKYERVCKQWCTLIRRHQKEVWRSKLVAAFPEGCLPVLYGQETYRDVAVLWWAWCRPWVVTSEDRITIVPGEVVEEIGVAETLGRTSGGFTRDMTSVIRTSALDCEPKGCRPDGQVVVRRYDKPLCSIDTVFTETKATARTVTDVEHVEFLRTSILVRQPNINNKTVTYEDWDSGSLIAQQPDVPYDSTLCGNHITMLHDHRSWDLFSVKNLSSRITTGSIFVVNETICAKLDPNPHPCRLTLTRLIDRTQIATYDLPQSESDIWVIDLTRFNVVLVNHFTRHIWVFDMKLNLLYKLSTRMRDEGLGDRFWGMDVDDWGMRRMECDHEWADIGFAFFDPKTRVYHRRPRPETLALADKKEGESIEEIFGLSDNDDYKRGYYLTTIEYPVDEEGKRTGAGGKTRLYWRWVE